MRIDTKIIIAICAVLLSTIIFLSALCWSFIVKIPEDVQANHDAAIISTIERRANREAVASVRARQIEQEVNAKALEKALTMLSGDVKHLTKTVEEQNAKLDAIGRYWHEYMTAPHLKQ